MDNTKQIIEEMKRLVNKALDDLTCAREAVNICNSKMEEAKSRLFALHSCLRDMEG